MVKHLTQELKLKQLEEQIELLQKRIDSLEDTLAVYADRRNWDRRASFSFHYSPGWHMARRALSGESTL